MTSINTNVDALTAYNNLQKSNNKLSTSLTRLSTGLRVNSGKDDPAGLIAGEFLRQEISSIDSAISNSNRANNVLSTADAALNEIGGLLDSVRGVLTTSSNKGVLSQDEIEANQATIDSAVSSINRIASSTQFAGRKLLDGSLGFQISGVSRADSGSGLFTKVRVDLANFNSNGDVITVTVTYTVTADVAKVTLAASTTTTNSTIEVVGNRGSVTVNIGSGQNIKDAVNGVSDATGVTASGNILKSVDYGENAFVDVKSIVGNLVTGSEQRAEGRNVVGTINGQSISGDGLEATLKTSNLEISLTFSSNITATGTKSFTIETGGAKFQLGQEINSSQQINVGIQSFFSGSLGSVSREKTTGTLLNRTLASITTGGVNSLLKDKAAVAADIVKQAIADVGSARARIGAVQKFTIETNINSLSVAKENLSASRSAIVDTDFAAETANLTRNQILVQAGTSVLSIANSRPQSVLSLLGR